MVGRVGGGDYAACEQYIVRKNFPLRVTASCWVLWKMLSFENKMTFVFIIIITMALFPFSYLCFFILNRQS